MDPLFASSTVSVQVFIPPLRYSFRNFYQKYHTQWDFLGKANVSYTPY